MNDNMVEHFTKQIFMLGAGKQYPVFKILLVQTDHYQEFLWEAVATFRHGHDVIVMEVTDGGDTAAWAIEKLFHKLKVIYKNNEFTVFPQ